MVRTIQTARRTPKAKPPSPRRKRGRPSNEERRKAALANKQAEQDNESEEEDREVGPKPAKRGRPSKQEKDKINMVKNTEQEPKAVIKPPPPTLDKFMKTSKPVSVFIGDNEDSIIELDAHPKQFATGSYGWTGNRIGKVPFGKGDELDVSISINITVHGSAPHKSLIDTTDNAAAGPSSSGSAGKWHR